MTIDEIIQELTDRIAKNIPISPSSWVESAMRLEVLASSLDEDLAMMQAKMEDKEAQLLSEVDDNGKEISSARAKCLAKLVINYGDYLKLKAKIKRIDSFIITARKRSQISNL